MPDRGVKRRIPSYQGNGIVPTKWAVKKDVSFAGAERVIAKVVNIKIPGGLRL